MDKNTHFVCTRILRYALIEKLQLFELYHKFSGTEGVGLKCVTALAEFPIQCSGVQTQKKTVFSQAFPLPP